MIKIELDGNDKYFYNSNGYYVCNFKQLLSNVAFKLYQIDYINDNQIHKISDDFEKIADLFGYPDYPSQLNKCLGVIYYKTFKSKSYPNANGKLSHIHIFIDKYDIIINRTLGEYLNYYIESVYINDNKYPKINLITNKLSDLSPLNITNGSLDKYLDGIQLDIKFDFLKLDFNVGEVKLSMPSIFVSFISRLCIKDFPDGKFIVDKNDCVNRVKLDIFESSLNDLIFITSKIGIPMTESDISIELGAIYSTPYHSPYMHDGDLNHIHISRGYIDIDIHRMNDTNRPNYYIESIIINSDKYPDLKFRSRSITEFNKKVRVTNNSLNKFFNGIPFNEFKYVMY